MLSLEVIGAMKLHAIVNSGDRLKDFVDIYVLLEHLPLNKLYDTYEKKYYPNVNRLKGQRCFIMKRSTFPTRVLYSTKSLTGKRCRHG
jgi:hypothetical protein